MHSPAPTLAHDQMFVPEIPVGQSIKLIGLGGVGSIVARYLSVFLASLDRDSRLVFIDADRFEAGNATRMLFSALGNKAEVMCHDLLPHFNETSLQLEAVDQFVTPENIEQLIQEGDIVLLTVDNHATRKLVSDYCCGDAGWPGLSQVVLISGGNDGVGPDSSGRQRRGTYGNCQIHIRQGGENLAPPLTDFHEEIRNPADKLPTDIDCVESLVSVPQVLFANMAAASAILNTLWLYVCGAVHYSELAFDIAEGLMRPLPRPLPHKPR